MTPALQDYSILITDDDAAARETLHEIFAPQGYRLFLAESGEEAIDIVRSNHVHIALLDMHLPRLSGLETLAIFRQMRGALPAILLSGYIAPRETLPGSLYVLSAAFPVTHFIQIARGIVVRGAGLSDVFPSVLALIVIAVVLVAAATARFRKSMA